MGETMNSPTCSQCDCVKGCSANLSLCPILVAECIASGQVSAAQIEAHRVLDAAIAQPEQTTDLAERIRREIDHCVMNDLRLVPNFGKRDGELAVRVSSLEAILETSAQPKQPAGDWISEKGVRLLMRTEYDRGYRQCKYDSMDAIAQPEQPAEPVAWRVRRIDYPGHWIIFMHYPVDAMNDPEREVQPLYEHPASVRQLLTTEEISDIFRESAGYGGDDFQSFARAIEAKITGKAE